MIDGGVRLEQWDPQDGDVSERRLLRVMEAEGFEIAVCTYPAGAVFDWHVHEYDKCDAVVDGILRIDVDGGETWTLQAGDRLYIPAGTRHRAQVMGRRGVLSLDGTKWG